MALGKGRVRQLPLSPDGLAVFARENLAAGSRIQGELDIGRQSGHAGPEPAQKTDAHHEPAELWMRTRLRTAACLVVALLLTSCGGGNSITASIQDSCKIPLLYANGSGTGSGTPIRTRLTESAPGKFNPCPLQKINSASVTLCLDHPQISELTAQLRLPDNSTLTLTLPTTASGPACLTNGTPFSVPLLANLLPHPNSGNGNWTVGVIDTNTLSESNPRGMLVGWSMSVEGLK
jgi:hypothetical protein